MGGEIFRRYSRGGTTVLWQPSLCIHSTRCFHGLPAVFDPSRRPWVDLEAAELEEILRQVAQCPSGALSIEGKGAEPAAVRAELVPGGPLVLRGSVTLVRPDGSEQPCSGTTAFCRCGASARKPFCDGSHATSGFKG